jgi:hypothetical protein
MIYAIADVPHEDYDNYDTLNKLFHALSPHGWKHSSYKNDTCPSLLKEERHGNYCQIFVDYVDPAMREVEEWPVLSYDCFDTEGCLTFHEEFDNVDKLIIYLTEKVTA